MEWKIKKFKDLDIEELYDILALRSEIFVVEQDCVFQECDGKDKSSYHLFCEDNGEVVAYSRILPKGVSYDETAIGRVVVKKSHRGRGLAREMMLKAIDFVEADLKENNIKLQAQSYLIEFYKSCGFKQISEEYLEDNIPHIDMLYTAK